MDTLSITWAGTVRSVPFGATAEPWADETTVAVLVHGRLSPLGAPLTCDATVEPVSLATRLGHRVYRRTLAFLLEAARRRIPGFPPLVPGPSWGGAYGFDTREGRPLDPDQFQALRRVLADLVEANLSLEPLTLPFDRAKAALVHADDDDIRLWLAQKNPPSVGFVRLGEGLFWAPDVLLPRTGLARVYSLEPTATGLLLGLPAKTWPLVLATGTPSPALARAHGEDRLWTQTQGVGTVARLNDLALRPGRTEAFIQGAEAVHERRIAALADEARSRGARVILVAGPSSSGKTTFAKRLAIQLEAVGLHPLVLSLDDYFVNREDTPLGPDGRYDFESLGAVDRAQLAADLAQLWAGGEAELPVFDFKTGRRKAQGRPYRLGTDGVLVLEGIHGLNPDLWTDRPAQGVFSIFVSALTSLTREGRTRISTSDHRLVRRMVRDSQFRGYPALHTLQQWPSVRRGEDDHLFPFQDRADGIFNSALPYELAVLREAALPLLESVPPGAPEYPQARYLLAFLDGFRTIPARLVPPFSILREFLGQSGFHY